MKRSLLVILFSSLLISGVLAANEVSATQTVNFKDIPQNHWAANSVYNCVRLGVTKGYPDGTFRGEQQVNRYELMVFLSNLSISLEKMVDEKMENNAFATEDGAVSNKALEELKTEIEILKEQLAAGGAAGSGRNSDLTPRFNLLFYAGPVIASTADEKIFTEQQAYCAGSLSLTKNIDENTGFEAEINTITSLELRGWSKRKLSDHLSMNFEATYGGGQELLSNKKIYNGYYPGAKVGVNAYGFNTYAGYNSIGTTQSAFDVDFDGVTDNLVIDRVVSGFSYRIPVAIPYIGFWTINSEIEKYYSEKDRNLNDQLSFTRYISRQNFDILKEVRLSSQYIKQITSVPAFNLDGDAIHAEKQGTYYDAILALGDIFKTGTTVSLMTAYMGSGFNQNNFLIPAPAANLLGYTSCGYFYNDWEGQNRMPSGNITNETGVSIQQDLYKKELFLNLGYIQGSALPDSSQTDDDTKYMYTLGSAGIDWYTTKFFKIFIVYEARALNDSSIENKSDQYSDKFAVMGMNLVF